MISTEQAECQERARRYGSEISSARRDASAGSGQVCTELEGRFQLRRSLAMPGGQANGAQGRNRTTDTAIFSRMLYQLSYLGVLQERGQSPSSGRFIVG